jgi:hypothetical protein
MYETITGYYQISFRSSVVTRDPLATQSLPFVFATRQDGVPAVVLV